MKRELNWDKTLLFLLPIIFLSLAYYIPGNTIVHATFLAMLVIIYELIFYKSRSVYGIDGIRYLSFPSLIYVSYTVLVAIPAVVLAASLEGERVSDFIVSILSFYLFFPLGLFIGNIFMPLDMKRMRSFEMPGLEKHDLDKIIYEILFILLTIMIGVVGLYLIRIDSYPILELIRNPEFYLSSFMMREEAFKLLKISMVEKYLFSMARDIFIPFLITGSLFLSIKYGIRKYWYLFGISLTLGLVNNSISLAKMPTAAIFLSLVTFYFLYKQAFKVRTILFSLASVLSFPYLVVYYVSIPELRHASILIPSILRRIFIVPSDILYQYFNIFPDFHGFLMGRSSKFFSWLHPEGGFNTANYVARVYWNEPQTTGSANAIFLGNFWADFGLIGVILSTFFVGWFIHVLYYQLLELSDYKKNIFYMSITTALVTTLTFSFVSSSITVLLVTKGLLVVPILLWMVRNKALFSLKSINRIQSSNIR